MSFSQLQSLVALMPQTAASQVEEAKKSSGGAETMKLPALKDFHATLDFMTDSVKDLTDAIETVSKYVPSSKVAAMKAALDAFTKKMEGVMTDVEVEIMDSEVPVSKLKESKLTEAKDYSDSGEFTDELFEVGNHIAKMKQTVRQPRWTGWMQVTDHNFSTSCVALNADFAEKLKELDTAFNALENELHSAE